MTRARLIAQTKAVCDPAPHGLAFTGFADTLTRLQSKEGPGAWWRGSSASIYYGLFMSTFVNSVAHIIRSKIIERCGNPKENEKPEEYFKADWLAKSITGSIGLFLCYPFEVAHTAMATDRKIGNKYHFTGTIDVWMKIYDKAGMAGLYRGFSLLLASAALHQACYIVFSVSFWLPLLLWLRFKPYLADFLISVGTSAVTYPLDTVRKCLVADVCRPTGPRFSGALETAKEIYKKDGFAGFFSGFAGATLRLAGEYLMAYVMNTHVLPAFRSLKDSQGEDIPNDLEALGDGLIKVDRIAA